MQEGHKGHSAMSVKLNMGNRVHLLAIVLILVCLRTVMSCPDACDCSDGISAICTNANLEAPPSGLPRNIIHLNLHNNNIENLSGSLNQYSSLRTLNISRNRLSSITNQSFFGLRHLEVLDLSNNHIQESALYAINALPNLLELHMSNCSVSSIDNTWMRTFNKLKLLDLSHNQIASIPDSTFRYLTSMNFLDLSHNYITNVTMTSFLGLGLLEQLYMDYNSLSELGNYGFTYLYTLKTLSVTYNQLTNLTSKALQGLISLRRFFLQHNTLLCLDDNVLSPLEELQVLDISHNDIDLLEPDVFKMNNKLEELYISAMPRLKAFIPGTFNGLVNLETLDISNNGNLSGLELDIFQPLRAMKTLYLHSSNLHQVPRHFFSNLTKLHTLSLHGNPLGCNCVSKWIKDTILDQSLLPRLLEPLELKCETPQQLKGWNFGDIPDMNFTCIPPVVVRHTKRGWFKVGSTAILDCETSGDPPPSVTWISPRGKVLTYMHHRIHEYVPMDQVQQDWFHENHYWHKTDEYHHITDFENRIHLLDNGSLYIDYVLRNDGGEYTCIARNIAGNDTAVTLLKLNYERMQTIKIWSIIFGCAAAGVFMVLSIIIGCIRMAVDKCKSRQKKKRKTIREIVDNIDAYKTLHWEKFREHYNIQKFRDNYHVHVGKLKEQLYGQMTRMQDHYHTQINKIKENGSTQMEKLRTNYNEQLGKMKDYKSQHMEKIRENYAVKVLRIREYSSTQMEKLRENYRLQQNHIMKILELMNFDQCKGVIEAECIRTESMLFDTEMMLDLNSEPDQAMSVISSEYMTADNSRSNSEACLNEGYNDNPDASDDLNDQTEHNTIALIEPEDLPHENTGIHSTDPEISSRDNTGGSLIDPECTGGDSEESPLHSPNEPSTVIFLGDNGTQAVHMVNETTI
ncbi:unnamed protein product [Owenia fusiformis]|uniref:Uncharacterized protein n=1 Tax=Owenia fusiformis TaxID=6347 RepID=A0A8J1TIK2_OWEFU|nr:unnamed protein product [Owenia fusiformis]